MEIVKRANRIGILGGTFDPVHNAHLLAAECAADALRLDAVVFIPSGEPPFKQGLATSGEHRLAMTKLACKENPRFICSDIEIARGGVSYTVDTLAAFAEAAKSARNPDSAIYFILGADAFIGIEKWREAGRLLKLVNFAVVTRPGQEEAELLAFAEGIREKYGAVVEYIPIPRLEISSTEIRARAAALAPISYLTPASVAEYINSNRLYYKAKTKEEMMEKLQKELPEKRLRHSIAVAECAVELAARFGADKEKAYIAGILHDCAKGMTKEKQRATAERYKIFPDKETLDNLNLIHSPLGAEMSAREYGAYDPSGDIQNAIKYHTVGRPGMSLLEKIIFVADYIEPGRSMVETPEIRRLAEHDLTAALIATLDAKAHYVKTDTHPLNRMTREYYINELIVRASVD